LKADLWYNSFVFIVYKSGEKIKDIFEG